MMTEFKATHTTHDGEAVVIVGPHHMGGDVVTNAVGSVWVAPGHQLTPIPDKREPPAEVWLRVHDGNELWRWSPTEIWNSHRYVLAPEGSIVLTQEQLNARYDLNRDYYLFSGLDIDQLKRGKNLPTHPPRYY